MTDGLDAVYLKPYAAALADKNVIEISVNRPGGFFVEKAGQADMEYRPNAAVTKESIETFAQYIAAKNNQYVNTAKPLFSGTLPTHERIQIVLSPSAAEGGAISIRKQYVQNISLDEYAKLGAFNNVKPASAQNTLAAQLSRLLDAKNYVAFIKQAIKSKISLLISGGTNTGKTTFLNACLREIPAGERIITIEDTRELNPPQTNVLKLLASKGDQGTADVTIGDLLEASLRLRPDRILIGELRGSEAFAFLRAINTGHPGSMTTVHANDTAGAYQQLELMALQSAAGKSLSREFLEKYIKTVMPVVIQLAKRGKERGVEQIYYKNYQQP